VQRKSERGEGHAAWADGGRTWLGGGRIKKNKWLKKGGTGKTEAPGEGVRKKG
jgi:hypothetical protein